MPAIDHCEPQVIRALAKAGWVLEKRPYSIHTPGATYYADLQLRSGDDERMIVVEVKCFPDTRSAMEELYRAIGQVMYYDVLLSKLPTPLPAYLSIPSHAYASLFRYASVRELAQRAKIRMIVMSLEREEIEQWINW
jgi:hypothetical protein